jgi:hypothetical protein
MSVPVSTYPSSDSEASTNREQTNYFITAITFTQDPRLLTSKWLRAEKSLQENFSKKKLISYHFIYVIYGCTKYVKIAKGLLIINSEALL